jgi:hypothetical protein
MSNIDKVARPGRLERPISRSGEHPTVLTRYENSGLYVRVPDSRCYRRTNRPDKCMVTSAIPIHIVQ